MGYGSKEVAPNRYREEIGRYFEDFEVGSKLVHAVPRTITEGEAAAYIGLTGSR